MSIRYWFPADEELNGASGIAITDEDGGFIAGTMKCFAGLALAGVLAANTLAAQLPYAIDYHGDERVAPATLLVDETGYRLPTPVIAPLAVQAFTDDSDFVAPVVASLGIERYQWPVFTGPVVPRIVQAVTDDTEYVGYLGTDEDGWIPPPPVVVPLVRAGTDDAEYVTPAASFFVERYEWPVVVGPQLVPPLVLPFADDSDYVTPPAATVLVDEDAGTWPRIVFVTPYVAPVTDDEVWTPTGITPVVPSPSVGSGAWIPLQRGPRHTYARVDYAKEDRKAARRRKRAEDRAALLVPRADRVVVSEPVGPAPEVSGAGFTVPETAPVVTTDFTLTPKPLTPAVHDMVRRETARRAQVATEKAERETQAREAAEQNAEAHRQAVAAHAEEQQRIAQAEADARAAAQAHAEAQHRQAVEAHEQAVRQAQQDAHAAEQHRLAMDQQDLDDTLDTLATLHRMLH